MFLPTAVHCCPAAAAALPPLHCGHRSAQLALPCCLPACRLRGEALPAKYQVREAGWHESIDSEVQVMLAGGWVGGWRAGGRIGGWAGCGLREIACLLFAPLLIAPPCALHPSTFDLLIPASATAPAPCSAGKSHRELAELESGIQEQLDSGAAADPEYWQAVLKRLHLHKAKARLRELHAGGWRAGWGVGVTAAPVCLRAGGLVGRHTHC
jgi:hypothetical protein